MAVASKSGVAVRKALSSKAREVTPLSAKTQRLPNPPIQLRSRLIPLWLLRLCLLQQRFSAIAFLLVAGMLAVYGWAVYSQQRWNQAYRQLETLQIHERQLTTTNEALKNQMLRQAQQPNTGLVPPNPAEAIVLPPAPERPNNAVKSASSSTNSSAQSQQTTPIPLGY